MWGGQLRRWPLWGGVAWPGTPRTDILTLLEPQAENPEGFANNESKMETFWVREERNPLG